MFECYYKELVGYFTRTLGDSEAAKDVVQETYLRISAMKERADAVLEPRAFLYQTAKLLEKISPDIIHCHNTKEIEIMKYAQIFLTKKIAPFPKI